MEQLELVLDKSLIKKAKLDYFGDDLIVIGFQYWKTYQPFEVQRISERYSTGVFHGNFGIN